MDVLMVRVLNLFHFSFNFFNFLLKVASEGAGNSELDWTAN